MGLLHPAEVGLVRFTMRHYINRELQGKAGEGAQGLL